MKKSFALIIAFALFLGACIYVVISSPVPTITHIKFEGDKSFIIGINNHDRVTLYHTLDNNKTFNLQLFNAKSLKESCKLIQNRRGRQPSATAGPTMCGGCDLSRRKARPGGQTVPAQGRAWCCCGSS